MIRASAHQETEANLYLAQFYDKGVNGLLFVVFNCTSILFSFTYLFQRTRLETSNEIL
jgi:hypothetical protein